MDGYGGSTGSFESCLFCWSAHQKHPEAKLRPVQDFYLFAHFDCMHACSQDACGEGTCVRGW